MFIILAHGESLTKELSHNQDSDLDDVFLSSATVSPDSSVICIFLRSNLPMLIEDTGHQLRESVFKLWPYDKLN